MSLALALVALRENNIREFDTLRWERERSVEGDRMVRGGFYVPVRVSLKV